MSLKGAKYAYIYLSFDIYYDGKVVEHWKVFTSAVYP